MPSAGKQLSELAHELHRRLTAAPDGSLNLVPQLEQLLTSAGAMLTDFVNGQPVLILGQNTGHLAAFLESLGCAVTVANPAQGIECLAAVSNQAPFGIALMLDAPSTEPLLQHLAALADYLFLAAPVPHNPADLFRAGWELCAPLHSVPDPADLTPFPRILRRADLFTNGRLLSGWYPAEGPRDGWRWAADLFQVRFPTPAHGWVRLVYFVPPDRFESTGPFTLGAMLAGNVLASSTVTQPGLFRLEIPIVHTQGATTDITFWVTPAASTPGDERLLGVIVRQILFVPAA